MGLSRWAWVTACAIAYGVGGGFRVGYLAPSPVSQIGVGQFVSDHVVRELLQAIGEPWLQHHAPASASAGRRTGHPHRAPLTGHEIIKGHPEARILP